MLFRRYRRTIQQSLNALLLVSFLYLCSRIYFYITVINLASDSSHVLQDSRNSVEKKPFGAKTNKNKNRFLSRTQEMVEKMKHSTLKLDAIKNDNEKALVKITEGELFRRLRSSNDGVSKDPLILSNLQVCEKKSSCVPFHVYKKRKFEKFVFDVNKHLNHSRIPPTLKPYPDSMPRPNPLIMVQDTSETVDFDLVSGNVEGEKERRLALGDDDLLKIPEVKRILKQVDGYTIPNLVHYVWFGCRRYKIHHFMSMLSALNYQNPDLILLHTNCAPSGEYWEAFQSAAGDTLKIVKRSPPEQIFNQKFLHVEHRSDVARLEILLEVGGIYIDDDVIVLRSLNDLRKNKMVLGEENSDALANSVILASKNSWFLQRWYQEYIDFNSSRWSDSSCFVPWALWQFFPNTITVVKEKMLRPNWEEIHYTYRELWDWRKSYTIHLFSRYMPKVDGIEERTMEDLAVLNTTYGEVARHALWGDYHIRDPMDFYL